MAEAHKVLIIGDSISMHMMPFLGQELAGEFAAVHNEGNASDSRNIVAHLAAWLASDADAHLVQLNCGLHDIKVASPGDARQVPLAEYRDNLRHIATHLKATGKPVVWATTTPVVDARHVATHEEFHRYNKDVLERNAVAAEIMAQAAIPINDLHAVITAAGPQACVLDDGVHLNERGSSLLARAVAQVVREHLRA